MAHCTNCGSELAPEATSCSGCGKPAAPPTMAAPPTTPVPPAAPAAPAAAGMSAVNVDLRRLLTGNWVGSAGVAVAMLATAAVLGAILGLMAKPADFGIDNTLTGIMMIVAATFGADAFLEGEFFGEDFEISSATSTYPLTATIITFVVGVLAFRRMVRDYPSAVPALGDALRVALFVSLPLLVGSLVFRSDLEDLGGGWISEARDEVGRGDSATWGVSAPSALFVSFSLVAFVLALACLARRDWWPGRSRPVAEWLAPAVQGVALMTALLPLCGLVGLGLIALGPDNDADLHDTTSDEAWAAVAVIAGGLGNGGQALLGLGSGAELGAAGEYEGQGEFAGEDESEEEFHRLGYYTDEGEEPFLWAAPAVLLLVLGGCALWVASRSRETSQVLRNLVVWCVLLLVAVPWLTRLANLHGGGSFEYEGDEAEFDGFVGLAGGQATFFIFLVAVVVSLLVALTRGAISGSQLRATFGRLQQNAGSAPPPSYPPPPPPPSYPPPGS